MPSGPFAIFFSINRRRGDLQPAIRPLACLLSKLKSYYPALAFVVLAGAVLFAFSSFLLDPQFAVRRVECRNCGPFSESDIQQILGLKATTDTIFTVSTSRLEEKLTTVPRIFRARVRKKFPDALVVQLEVREVAAVALFSEPYALAEDGSVLGKLSGAERKALLKDPDVLKLSVPVSERNRDISPQWQPIFRQAIELFRLYRKRGLDKFLPIESVAVDPVLGYIILSRDIKLFIGGDRLKKRLLYLRRLFSLLGPATISRLEKIYLNFEKNYNRAVISFKNSPGADRKEGAGKEKGPGTSDKSGVPKNREIKKRI